MTETEKEPAVKMLVLIPNIENPTCSDIDNYIHKMIASQQKHVLESMVRDIQTKQSTTANNLHPAETYFLDHCMCRLRVSKL